MSILGRLFFLSLICFQFCVSDEQICHDLINRKPFEQEAIEELESHMYLYKDLLVCIDVFLRRGFYALTTIFLQNLSRYKVEFKEVLRNSVKNIGKELDELENKYRFDQTDYKK